MRVRGKEEAMKKISYKYTAPWIVIASMLFLAASQPSAYGLEFPMTTHLALPDQIEERALAIRPESTDAVYGGFSLKASSKKSLFSRRKKNIPASIVFGRRRATGITRLIIIALGPTEFLKRYQR
jgi:hypothetical protein